MHACHATMSQVAIKYAIAIANHVASDWKMKQLLQEICTQYNQAISITDMPCGAY